MRKASDYSPILGCYVETFSLLIVSQRCLLWARQRKVILRLKTTKTQLILALLLIDKLAFGK